MFGFEPHTPQKKYFSLLVAEFQKSFASEFRATWSSLEIMWSLPKIHVFTISVVFIIVASSAHYIGCKSWISRVNVAGFIWLVRGFGYFRNKIKLVLVHFVRSLEVD